MLFNAVILFLIFTLLPQQVLAEFEFYTQACNQDVTNGCAGPLVAGPRCLSYAPQQCKLYKTTKRCKWVQSQQFEDPKFKCVQEQGDCLEYEQACNQYEKICKSGYKKICHKKLKPYGLIKDELAWLIYRQYMQGLKNEKSGLLHQSFTKELQPFFRHDLKQLKIVHLLSSIKTSLTDCSTVYFPQANIMTALTQGQVISKDSDLKTVLHAFKHAEQCLSGKGRKQTAVAWFGKISLAMHADVNQILKEVGNQVRSYDGSYLHGLIPGEAAARSFVEDNLKAIKEATRHGEKSFFGFDRSKSGGRGFRGGKRKIP